MTTGLINEYRRRAAECRAQAEKVNVDAKDRWLQLAAKWGAFADDAERRLTNRRTDENRTEPAAPTEGPSGKR
jgi:hypothetical protein